MRIGVVPYINAHPLYLRLAHPVVKATPAELNRLITNGELDLSLLPVFATFNNPDLIPCYEGGVIQSFGAVESVCVFYKETIDHPSQIKKINYTSDSVTSINLFKVLFEYYWEGSLANLQPADVVNADALLIIGDDALTFSKPGFKKLDLGEAWTNLTKLPFIYAGWTGRKSTPTSIIPELKAATADGIKLIPEIIKTVSLPLSNEQLSRYFKKSLSYQLHENGPKALALFKEYCIKLKIIANC